MIVQLFGVVGDASKIWWDEVTKIGVECVTGDGLGHGKAGMVDPTESLSMVSRGWVIRLLGKAVECFENTIVVVVVKKLVSKRARRVSTGEYVEKEQRRALVKSILKY